MAQSGKWLLLPDAAQLMYDELDGTPWRKAADAHGESASEGRLDYMATHLVQNASIEGRSPPTSSHRQIPSSEFGNGAIKGGGKYFQRHYESYLTFVDMRVKEEDVRELIRRMQAGE